MESALEFLQPTGDIRRPACRGGRLCGIPYNRRGTVKNGTYLSDQITPIADPTRAGYTFAGWSREDGTQITTGQISGMPAGTLLTAVWTREE
ncbi:MAG: InlB B-repeat-containing protein [Oscillospiraceae bacterium]|nr:MAG: InlB B-repeat-containing protein [Oscillospiraceae bacterium]